MSYIFWVVSTVVVILAICKTFIAREWFGITTYLLIGVYVPLFMSFNNWSPFYIADKGDVFYYIFICFGLACISLLFFTPDKPHIAGAHFGYNRKGLIPLEFINAIYIASILVENYYLSGYLVPSFHSIDIHTSRMPYIYFITTGVYIISLMNYIEYSITKKKRYLLYLAVVLSFNVITKASRIDAFICIVQLLSIHAFMTFTMREKTAMNGEATLINRRSKRRMVISLICIVLVVLVIGVIVGDARMNAYGKYDLVYSEGIAFSGIVTPGNILAYYYGYFALSFDNLAHNLLNNESQHNYIGLRTFRTLYFGILQFDNLFGLDGGAATKANLIRSRAAAVATGFWDFYYDYGLLIFIPFLISFAIYLLLRRKMSGKAIKIEALACYFYWVPLWMFMSFDNRVYDYQVIWHILVIILLVKRRYALIYQVL